ncbi:MAG: SirB2 family protein [Gammaproteobacteria bacterium]|nr:SirB2 family protein [Gammaproteobacteria bacterium]
MRTVHLITITVTICGFVLRGIWMLKGSPLLKALPVRILPHVNDTILLISAVWTATFVEQYPLVNGWLTAKMLGLLAYIVLGAIALSYGRTRQIRIRAFVGALLCFSYVVLVAATRNPLVI